MSATGTVEKLEQEFKRLQECVRGIDHDVGLQLSQMQTLIRTERKLADDRHETQMARFDSLDGQLHALMLKLSTNGSGHGG